MSDVPGTPGGVRLVAGRYHLLSPLDEDATGVVWLARDEVLGRQVAVREVKPPPSLGAGEVRDLYEHLENAARAAGRVSHRNVVAVHDVASEDGRPWIVMEPVRGLSLSDVLDAEGPLSPRRAAHIGAEVLAALRAAHAAGVLHLDVRPSNVLIANDGRVMVTGFGALTARDTPGFGAPEVLAGREPGPESDLWSLGAMLHAATEGRSAFGADHGRGEQAEAGRTDTLGAVVTELLHRNPAERLDAAEAEHRLRLASAGGGVRTDVPVSAATPSAAPETGPRTAPEAEPAPGRTASATTAAAPQSDDSKRATTVLAVGVALLLLFVVALVWLVAGGG
ncbi:serine/threonine-protein kinase [Streptomyces kurssanovii]|uniref:non-specific serine/threonine protein kinase n=1 Tax=Streptomyces kurssanovii TaxID=67312 RepID=A0ABV3HZ97_9ACTN